MGNIALYPCIPACSFPRGGPLQAFSCCSRGTLCLRSLQACIRRASQQRACPSQLLPSCCSAAAHIARLQYPGGYELYDLSTDPDETENIFSSASPVRRSPSRPACQL